MRISHFIISKIGFTLKGYSIADGCFFFVAAVRSRMQIRGYMEASLKELISKGNFLALMTLLIKVLTA